MPPIRLLLATAALLATSACSGSDEPAPAPASPSPTPLSEFATNTLTVGRADFCSRVAPAAVEDALGRSPRSHDRWVNGDRAVLAPGVRDVAHEYGCRWSAGHRTAQGWVFAPPITVRAAGQLRRSVADARGCHAVPDAPRFGARSVAVRCADGTTSFHGLFGDAWLSCSVTAPGAAGRAALESTGRWCVSVAQAAAI